MQLTRFEQDSLDGAMKIYEKLPEDSGKFIKQSSKRYGRKVEDFDPKKIMNYNKKEGIKMTYKDLENKINQNKIAIRYNIVVEGAAIKT